MDTITILGISLLFFYSLTTILQFYGIDTSIYSIYILFYIFIIVSRLILPMNYNKLFPDAEAPLTNADDTGSGKLINNVSGSITNDVASSPLTNTDDNVSEPTIVFPPPRPQGQIKNIDRASPPTPVRGQVTYINRASPPTRSQGQITNIDRASPPTSPSPDVAPVPRRRITEPLIPAPDPSTIPPPTKNETPGSSGYVDLSGFVQGLASLFSGVA